MIKIQVLAFVLVMGFITIGLAANKDQNQAQTSDPTVQKEPPIRSFLNTPFLRRAPEVKYREPWDLIGIIPILRDIDEMLPRRFSIANYHFYLAPHEMVIKHQFLDRKTRETQKNSIIMFTYDDISQRMNTFLEVPLFYSSLTELAEWGYYPLGNYTMRITPSGNVPNEERLYLKAITRF